MPAKQRKAGMRRRPDTPRKNKTTEQKGQRPEDTIQDLTSGLVKGMVLRTQTIRFALQKVWFCNTGKHVLPTHWQATTYAPLLFFFQLQQERHPPRGKRLALFCSLSQKRRCPYMFKRRAYLAVSSFTSTRYALREKKNRPPQTGQKPHLLWTVSHIVAFQCPY